MGRKEPIVVDANVLISALIKPLGFTSRLLLKLATRTDLYLLDYAINEVERYLLLIARKRGVDQNLVRQHLKNLSNLFRFIKLESVKKHLPEALTLVHDPSDAPYVATALHLLQSHPSITILTFNKKDYKTKKLQNKNIHILPPPDL